MTNINETNKLFTKYNRCHDGGYEQNYRTDAEAHFAV